MVGEKILIFICRYVPPYDAERPLETQLEWERHRAFMNVLEAEGMVRLGGPLEGAGEVLLVFRAVDATEIDQRLADDPGPDRASFRQHASALESAHRQGRIDAVWGATAPQQHGFPGGYERCASIGGVPGNSLGLIKRRSAIAVNAQVPLVKKNRASLVLLLAGISEDAEPPTPVI